MKVNLCSQVTAKNIDPAGVNLVMYVSHAFARELKYIDFKRCIVIPRNKTSRGEWLSHFNK